MKPMAFLDITNVLCEVSSDTLTSLQTNKDKGDSFPSRQALELPANLATNWGEQERVSIPETDTVSHPGMHSGL